MNITTPNFMFKIANSINPELLLSALIIGFLGSLAYYTAVYFKFIGGKEEYRKLILSPFINDNGKTRVFRLAWYCFIGGFIAVVFQLPQLAFAPIQSFILGCSWPSIVVPFLSARMYEPTKEEKDELATRSQAISKRDRLPEKEITTYSQFKKQVEKMIKKNE